MRQNHRETMACPSRLPKMPINAIEGLAPEWYTPPGQDEENPTRFKVRPLDGAEFGEVADAVKFTDTGSPYITSAGRDRALVLALTDWENFNDSKGPMLYTRNNMRLIPHETRVAIVNRILAISTLTGEQEKN